MAKTVLYNNKPGALNQLNEMEIICSCSCRRRRRRRRRRCY